MIVVMMMITEEAQAKFVERPPVKTTWRHVACSRWPPLSKLAVTSFCYLVIDCSVGVCNMFVCSVNALSF